jgi:PIN like domain
MPSGIVYYLDADIPIAVSRAIAGVRTDVVYPGAPGCEITSPEIHDIDWLPIVSRNQWVAITRDKRIRHRRAERRAWREHGIRAFVLTSSGNLTMWRTLQLLARHWDAIEQTVVTCGAGPYLYAVTQEGVREIHVPET